MAEGGVKKKNREPKNENNGISGGMAAKNNEIMAAAAKIKAAGVIKAAWRQS
jgi:hypothetical protein